MIGFDLDELQADPDMVFVCTRTGDVTPTNLKNIELREPDAVTVTVDTEGRGVQVFTGKRKGEPLTCTTHRDETLFN